MKLIDQLFEKSARSVAQRSSRRGLLKGLGATLVGAATIPLLPAKQRIGHPADWMETDSRVICPDPACGLIMRIDREGLRILNHDDVSPISWDSIETKGEGS